jgi:hypothetical protein
VSNERGELRLAGLLIFLGRWGEGDTSRLPRLKPYDPPTSGPLSFGSCRPARVHWVTWDTGLARSKVLRTGVLAEVEAAWLRWQGHRDVRVEPIDDDDDSACVLAKL